jgi:hypothetical protein
MEIIRDRASSVDLEEFLARPRFAHLATASERGPRDSPVWFLWEDHAVWIIGSKATDTFPERIEAEARCAVGIVDFDRGLGHVQHVGMRGRATVERFDSRRARRLLARRFVPESVVVRDVSYAP